MKPLKQHSGNVRTGNSDFLLSLTSLEYERVTTFVGFEVSCGGLKFGQYGRNVKEGLLITNNMKCG